MKTATLMILWIGAAFCGLFAIILSPWWLIGFVWFLGIGYLNAKDSI